jgi:hypothetical protein
VFGYSSNYGSEKYGSRRTRKGRGYSEEATRSHTLRKGSVSGAGAASIASSACRRPEARAKFISVFACENERRANGELEFFRSAIRARNTYAAHLKKREGGAGGPEERPGDAKEIDQEAR